LFCVSPFSADGRCLAAHAGGEQLTGTNDAAQRFVREAGRRAEVPSRDNPVVAALQQQEIAQMAPATKTIEEDIQALRTDMEALTKSVSAIATGAANGAQKGADKGMNGAARAGREFAADAAKLTSDSARFAEGAASDATSLIAAEIKRNPFVAVAAALTLGFVAGIVQRR